MSAVSSSNQVVSTAPAKGLNIGLWIAQVLVALMLAAAGLSKLTGAAPMVALFEAVGVGQWFRFVTGTLEVLGAVLLVIPKSAPLGALLLAGVMAGAVSTHLFIIGGNPAMPLVLLAANAFILWGRKAQLLTLIKRS